MRHLCQRPELEFRFDDRAGLRLYNRLIALLSKLTTSSMIDFIRCGGNSIPLQQCSPTYLLGRQLNCRPNKILLSLRNSLALVRYFPDADCGVETAGNQRFGLRIVGQRGYGAGVTDQLILLGFGGKIPEPDHVVGVAGRQ